MYLNYFENFYHDYRGVTDLHYPNFNHIPFAMTEKCMEAEPENERGHKEIEWKIVGTETHCSV